MAQPPLASLVAVPKPAPKADLPKPEAPQPAPQSAPAPGVILISASQRKLMYQPADGGAPMVFPIAVGRHRSLIPFGSSEVVRKRKNPTWYPTPTMRKEDPTLPVSVPPGPKNPMGAYALDLGWTYYRIHGTNAPDTVGHAASSGCFRMLPKDIEALYPHIAVGTKVHVFDGPLPPATPAPAVPVSTAGANPAGPATGIATAANQARL